MRVGESAEKSGKNADAAASFQKYLGWVPGDVGAKKALAQAYRTRRPGQPAAHLRRVSAREYYGAGYDDSVVRIPSIAKATRLLGWRPRLSVPQMLPAIVDDYLARYQAIIDARIEARLRDARVAPARLGATGTGGGAA